MRDFAEADLPALIDLWAAAWTATGIPIDFGPPCRIDDRLRAARAEIVVGLGGKPAGAVAIDPQSRYLGQLFVAPAERGAGMAVASIRRNDRLFEGAACDHLPP